MFANISMGGVDESAPPSCAAALAVPPCCQSGGKGTGQPALSGLKPHHQRQPQLNRAYSEASGWRRRDLRLRFMASAVQLGSLQRVARHNLLATTGAVLIVVFVILALFGPWIAPQDPDAHRSAIAIDGAIACALVRHRRTGAGHSVARHLWSAHFDAGGKLRGGGLAHVGADLRVDRGLLRRLPRPLSERDRDERLHVVSRESCWRLRLWRFSARDCSTWYWRCRLAGGWAMPDWCGRRCWRCESGNSWKRRVRWVQATCESWCGIFCPNIIQPVIVQAAIGMAGAILAEATMSFLGLGVPPPTATWGSMLNDAPLASFRCAAPGALPCRGGHAGGAVVQLHRRRAAGLSGSEIED